jgi:Fic family protein
MAISLKDSPVGSLVPTDAGQMAFVPNPLPRVLDIARELGPALDKALILVSRLGGVGETLPNPHLLIAPFLRREAVLSSKIEGTQASMSDVYKFEAGSRRAHSEDVREVINYIHAVNWGLEKIASLPICIRLANEMHARLMVDVRGQDKRPGELRNKQNWIGKLDTPIEMARYIPPPHNMVPDLMSDWEKFTNEPSVIPVLVRCALMHYQFEAIHPYEDGNGRIGRALIMLFLRQEEVLSTPLLYMSAYFEARDDEYRDHLLGTSQTGDWLPWIRFFLEGVAVQAQDALDRSLRIRELQDDFSQRLKKSRASANAFRLLDQLFTNPYVTIPGAAEHLGLTYAGAQGVVKRLSQAGILEKDSGRWRPTLFVARELLNVLE